MQVIIATILAIGSVAAGGSGPYLPSGWRPQGPAFYLPTENQANPIDDPVQVTIFQETEASGSDTLREYGPPKLQEVTINFGNQGLPDIATEQIFQTAEISTNQEVENNLVIEEEKPAVTEIIADTESKVVEENQAIQESFVEKFIPTQSAVEEEIAVTETAVVEGLANVQLVSDDEGIASTQQAVVEEIVDLDVSAPVFEGRSLDINIQAEFEDSTQVFTDALESSQASLQIKETTDNVIELKQGNEEIASSTALNVETEHSEITTPSSLVVEDSVLVLIAEDKPNVEEAVAVEKSEQLTNAEEKIIDEVTKDVVAIENEAAVGVNNIAEALVQLENEIRAEQVVTEVKTVQEVSGLVGQAPEGFLEYGPPGFREYGPPKGDDLLRSLDQDVVGLSNVETNELRRRRYSPKFRSTKKIH